MRSGYSTHFLLTSFLTLLSVGDLGTEEWNSSTGTVGAVGLAYSQDHYSPACKQQQTSPTQKWTSMRNHKHSCLAFPMGGLK